MLVGSVPMSLVGVWLAARLTQRYGDNVKDLMGQVLGAALLFGAVGLVAKSLVRAKERRPGLKLTNRDRAAAVLIGIFGGFVVGLTSVGSGVFFGLTLLVVFPLRAHKVVERRSSMRQCCSTSRVPPTGWRETSTSTSSAGCCSARSRACSSVAG